MYSKKITEQGKIQEKLIFDNKYSLNFQFGVKYHPKGLLVHFFRE